MRLPLTSRRASAEQAEAARERVTALNRRSGWVPRVPPEVERGIAPSFSMVDHPGDPIRPRPGRHARRPPAESPAAETPVDGGHGGPSGVLAPVADRLPLPLRAVLSALPAGVRNGSAGLQASHAVVLVLAVALGLTVTVLLTGIGRPRVSVVEPVQMSTILATGTPVAAPVAGEHDAHDQAPVANAEPAEVVVHVTGLVVRPGIVVLPAGSRVVDAVEKAGGLDGDVDLTTLNLARVLADGEQIFVGIEPPPGAQSEPATSGAPGGVSSRLIDLNAATAHELESLPGIGPALAERIIQWREQHGRFTAVDELLEVAGIGPAKYAAIAELVTV